MVFFKTLQHWNSMVFSTQLTDMKPDMEVPEEQLHEVHSHFPKENQTYD